MLTYNRVFSFATGLAMLALLIGFSGTTQAQNNGKSEKIPYNFAFSPCAGEMIEVTGNANFIFNLTEDENGCITVKYHYNSQNVTGVGMMTGDEYRIIDVANQQVKDVTVCGGCTVDIHFTSTWKVKAKNGESFNLRQNIILTIDVCTGEFIVKHQNFDSGCS